MGTEENGMGDAKEVTFLTPACDVIKVLITIAGVRIFMMLGGIW